MTDLTDLSAEQILKVDTSIPEKIFTLDDFEHEFQRLRHKWHPDVNSNPKAKDVFIHIMSLAKIARSRIMSNSWNGKATLTFSTSSGKTFRFQYRQFHTFELGGMYIGTHKIAYVIDDKNKDLYENGVKAISGIRYPNNKFKKEFTKFLPNVVFKNKTNIGYVVVMDKPENAVLLRDLIEYVPNNTIDPKHVAWIVSSLYNLTTFLDHIGICHNSILPTTIFVDPNEHTIMLFGGWWYSTKVGSKLKAIPTELLKILPSEVLDKKIAKSSYDRLAVKGVAVGCLGDSTLVGSKLLVNKEIPKPFLNWIRMPSNSSSIEEYEGWQKALKKSFGKRKFVKFDFDINNIY